MSDYKLLARTEDEWAKLEAEEQRRFELERMEIANAPDSPLHENLRKLRERMNLKKQEMAKIMEVTPRTYYTYEEGARSIPSNTLIKLAVRTGVDLNTLLLGRSGTTDRNLIQSAIADLVKITDFLKVAYPKMDGKTAMKVAKFSVTFDWQGWPRLHPDMIRDAVRMVTRYRFHPEDLPAPPFWEHYGEDQALYEENMAAWQAMVDEDFPPAEEVDEEFPATEENAPDTCN